MDLLPRELISLILLHLDVHDIFICLRQVSTFLKEVCSSSYFLTELLKTQINSSLSLSIPSEECISLIKEIYLQDSLSNIDFYGFGTDGGVDSDLPCYWVQNLFACDSSAYCSALSANVNCVGILRSEVQGLINKAAAVRAKALEVVSNYKGISSDVGRLEEDTDLLAMSEREFIDHWESSRNTLVSTDMRYSVQELQEVCEYLKSKERNLDVFKVSDDANLLVQEICNVNSSVNPRCVACVREVEVDRSGNYSCPLRTFIVFISEEYLDLTSDLFKLYNNLRSSRDVSDLIKYDSRVPKALPVISGPSFEYRVFERSRAILQPIIWGKFKSPTKVKASIRLDDAVSGRFLYVKLIDCDNRMAEFQDDATFTNIDCTYIGVKGQEIKLP